MNFDKLVSAIAGKTALKPIPPHHFKNIFTFNDAETFKRICAGDEDIFALVMDGTAGFKQLLADISPGSIEELIAALVLYRPGPLGSGMAERYIKAKKDPSSVSYISPQLHSILSETYGVLLYPEQVAEAAVLVAGFSQKQTEAFMRALRRRSYTDSMVKERKEFIHGARRQNNDEQEAEKIFSFLFKYHEYVYSRHEAALYACAVYQLAYLKTHFPSEYAAAC